MFTASLTSGLSFGCKEGSILDAATQAGVVFPYSCKTGRCGACRCKIVRGETYAEFPESGLSEQEKEDGWILSCARSAKSDLTLEVEDLGGVELPPVKTLPCRVSHLERLAPDVLQVKLRLPPTAEFSFIPGQYIDVIGPNGIRRSYSLASASFAEKVLELHIRSVDGGVLSEYWFKRARVNDLLRLNGPLGTFFLRDTAGMDLVFLATGTGIAPVKAMLESLSALSAEQSPRSVTVLWGGRVLQDLYFDVGCITAVSRFVPVLSRADAVWEGARGYVQQVLLELFSDLGSAAVYACGSDSMIRGAKELLLKNGLPSSRFYSDAFLSSSI